MTKLLPALCSAVAIPLDGADVPEWLQLLPQGEIQTQDGRGPFRVTDAATLLSASLQAGQKLVLDVCHSTDLAAPRGEEAPARGWIVELQSRADGVWGRVEWTDSGRQIMADKQYRGISPVIMHRKDGAITRILRASLTNNPNLIGLASLHQEGHQDMDWKSKLIELLGLDSNADDAAIDAALAAKVKSADDDAVATAVQSALAPIAKAAGLSEGADSAAVLAGVQGLASRGGGEVVALQQEIVGLTGKLDKLTAETARDKATAFVDGEIRNGRVGLKPVRAEYIDMHMADPAKTTKLIEAMPVLNSGQSVGGREADVEEFDNPQLLAAAAGAYQKKMADAGQTIDFGAAVRAVQEGKHK